MPIITTKEVKREQARVNRFVAKWRTRFNLASWDLTTSYTITPLNPNAMPRPNGTSILAQCDVAWHYKQAHISFYVVQTVNLTDAEVEKVVIHELCHVLVNEMRANDDNSMPVDHRLAHEERVVTEMTNAFYWTDRMACPKPKLRSRK